MLSSMIPALTLALLGNVIIYSGLMFINGAFAPALLRPLYAITSEPMRLAVMMLIFAVPANWIFAKVYTVGGPAAASMAMIGSVAVVATLTGILIDGRALNLRLLLAFGLVVVACLWLGYEMGRPTKS